MLAFMFGVCNQIKHDRYTIFPNSRDSLKINSFIFKSSLVRRTIINPPYAWLVRLSSDQSLEVNRWPTKFTTYLR